MEIIAGDVLGTGGVHLLQQSTLPRQPCGEIYIFEIRRVPLLNYPVLAEAGTHIVFDKPEIRKKPTGKFPGEIWFQYRSGVAQDLSRHPH